MSSAVQCNNCGAMMTPQWDGRVYQCPFCKTQMQVAIGADQIAAGMAIDLANVDAFLGKLAAALQQGFAERARIRAEGAHVLAIEIDLDQDRFIVERKGQEAVARHKKMVRGIALRTKTLTLDVWFSQLTTALATHANANARAAWVLGQLGHPQR
jgi:hypothetical protein